MTMWEFLERLDKDPWDPALLALWGIKTEGEPITDCTQDGARKDERE